MAPPKVTNWVPGETGMEPAGGRHVTGDVAQEHARIGGQEAGFGIEGVDRRGGAAVDQQPGIVVAAIAVGAPVAEGQDRRIRTIAAPGGAAWPGRRRDRSALGLAARAPALEPVFQT